jgi:ribosomal protein S18 acetylase RimI-like enzyme
MPAAFTISPVHTPEDLAAIRLLFRAYAESLPVDLAYQGFEAELAALPGKYAPPSGALLLARGAHGKALGCVAMRPMAQPELCEMKRLFVLPEGRGLGLGRALAHAIIAAARACGYSEICLDTLPTMTGAQELYGQLGFKPVAPYYATPVAGTVFLALRL